MYPPGFVTAPRHTMEEKLRRGDHVIVALDPTKHRNRPSQCYSRGSGGCARDVYRARYTIQRAAKAIGVKVRTSVDPQHTYVIGVPLNWQVKRG